MLITADEVHALSLQVKALDAPSRQIDALIMRALLAHRVEKNPRICVLDDNRSAPLFMEWEAPPADPLMQRLERAAKENGEDVLYFEHEGKWLHFVSHRVPKLTSSLDASLSVRDRIATEYPYYRIDSVFGTAEIFDASTGHFSQFQNENKIPEISLAGAILRTRYFRLRDSNDGPSGD